MPKKLKLTKRHINTLLELYKLGSTVPTSEWTTGKPHGRFINRRTLPPYSEVLSREDTHTARGDIVPRRVRQLFTARPRVRAVVAIIDLSTVRTALFDAGLI